MKYINEQALGAPIATNERELKYIISTGSKTKRKQKRVVLYKPHLKKKTKKKTPKQTLKRMQRRTTYTRRSRVTLERVKAAVVLGLGGEAYTNIYGVVVKTRKKK